MYRRHELHELFSEDNGIIDKAIELYNNKYGNCDFDNDVFPDDIAETLDEFFTAAKSLSGIALKAIDSNKDIESVAQSSNKAVQFKQFTEILGTQGVTVLLASVAVQKGVNLAKLAHDLTVQSYQQTAAKLNKNFVDQEQEDNEWLKNFGNSAEKQRKFMTSLGVPDLDPDDFSNLIEKELQKVKNEIFTTQYDRSKTIDVGAKYGI